jgi:hypothetical protein
MAPEVGLGQPYNLSADVYSWSMVMWFILALEPPFGFYTENMIADRVFKRGSRPAIFKRWKESIGELMKRAWDTDHVSRPSFLEIRLDMSQELIDCDDATVAGSSVANSALSLNERERADSERERPDSEHDRPDSSSVRSSPSRLEYQ